MTSHEMEKRIRQTYPNCDVAVIDLTGTSNHFEVRIHEESLKALSRIQQHRTIMGVFKEELGSGEIHALTIKTI